MIGSGYIAKNIVASGLAKRCKVEIAYMIGVAEPASLSINTYGDADDEKLLKIVKNAFPLKPSDIITKFKLKKPIYGETAKWGHFGRNHYEWEKTDKADLVFLAKRKFLLNSRTDSH